MKWFENVKGSRSCKFLQFDIDNFYPSISEDLLIKALDWAEQYTFIDERSRRIVMHSRRNFLFDGQRFWCKSADSKFDVTMGAFDGGEVCELVGLYMLHQVVVVKSIFEKEQIGLYRDDGLCMVEGGGPQIDHKRKELIKVFKENRLNITVEANTRRVSFLDVILDLDRQDYRPYHKPNAIINYVRKGSNHPPRVIENIPTGVNKRLNSRASNKQCFEEEKRPY